MSEKKCGFQRLVCGPLQSLQAQALPSSRLPARLSSHYLHCLWTPKILATVSAFLLPVNLSQLLLTCSQSVSARYLETLSTWDFPPVVTPGSGRWFTLSLQSSITISLHSNLQPGNKLLTKAPLPTSTLFTRDCNPWFRLLRFFLACSSVTIEWSLSLQNAVARFPPLAQHLQTLADTISCYGLYPLSSFLNLAAFCPILLRLFFSTYPGYRSTLNQTKHNHHTFIRFRESNRTKEWSTNLKRMEIPTLPRHQCKNTSIQ